MLKQRGEKPTWSVSVISYLAVPGALQIWYSCMDVISEHKLHASALQTVHKAAGLLLQWLPRKA